MTLARPSALLTVDGREFTAQQAALVGLVVRLESGSHDRCELTLWPQSALAGAAPGASLDVALGALGAEEPVWSGALDAVRRTPATVVLEALGHTAALSRARVSASWSSQSVADIVRDLAGDVKVDAVDVDVDLASYSVDDRRTVWSHLRELAQWTGAQLSASTDGALRFVRVGAPRPAHSLRHGADVVEWRIGPRATSPAPTVVAHGSASENGASRWHWTRRDPVGVAAAPTRVPAVFADRAGADTLATALRTRAERGGVRGRVVTLGRASLRAGEWLEIVDLPGGDLGPLLALSVEHRLDGSAGFLTAIRVEGPGGGGLAGGLLGGLL